MALENQPLFQAPSLPKMGKDSSPLMKGAKTIGVSFAKPKLKASKMSFVRAKKAKAIKAEDLKGPETVSTGSLATTLTETNRILVEIQNQLAIDFANRIAEKKSILQLSRKQVRKKKLIAKEDFVERGKGLVQNIKDFGKKVLSPVKGIFDKIIDFLTIIGGGIALNAAFEWLSDKENREKLVRIFNFLRDHWKTLLAIVIGGKILGLLLKLKGLFSLARSLTRRLKDLFGKNGKFKPGSQDFCRGVLSCVTSLLPAIIAGLLASAAFIGGLKPQLGIPGNAPTGTPVPTVPTVPPPEPPITAPPPEVPWWQTDLAQFLGYGALALGATALIVPALANIFTGPADEVAALLEQLVLMLEQCKLLSRLRGIAPKVKPPTAPPPVAPAASSAARSFTRPPTATPPAQPPAAATGLGRTPTAADLQAPLLRAPRVISKTSPGGAPTTSTQVNYVDAIKQTYQAAKNKNFTYEQAIQQLKDVFGKSDIDTLIRQGALKKFSRGGTIPGKGPTNVDSVPAILAPGEEVIKTSSANMFRPVLKDINDNAGRMFLSFKSGVEQQARNFGLQQEETTRSVSLFKKFGDLIEKQVKKLELQQLEKGEGIVELLNILVNDQSQDEPQITLASNNSSITQPQASLMSNTTGIFTPQTEAFVKAMRMISEEHENNKPKLELVGQQPVGQQPVRLETVPFKPEIQTYTHRRTTSESSGEGSIETMSVNLPPTVIQGPGQQQQAQPQEQPSESASPDILIAPMDLDNPFFARSSSAYGVDL